MKWIARFKNLTDGDTLFRLTVEAVSEDVMGARQGKEELVQERVEQCHRLLLDGNPLIPVETLRAVNLTLLRAIKKAHVAQRWMQSVRGVQALLSPLGSFASQAAASAQSAMLHELARCYALSLFAAPDAAVDVALGLLRARVPTRFIQEVAEQADLLEVWFPWSGCHPAAGSRCLCPSSTFAMRTASIQRPGNGSSCCTRSTCKG